MAQLISPRLPILTCDVSGSLAACRLCQMYRTAVRPTQMPSPRLALANHPVSDTQGPFSHTIWCWLALALKPPTSFCCTGLSWTVSAAPNRRCSTAAAACTRLVEVRHSTLLWGARLQLWDPVAQTHQQQPFKSCVVQPHDSLHSCSTPLSRRHTPHGSLLSTVPHS